MASRDEAHDAALAKLIKRAEAFRETLAKSVPSRGVKSEDTVDSLDRLIDTLLTDDDSQLSEAWDASDSSKQEAALLDELFFSVKKTALPARNQTHTSPPFHQGDGLRLLVTIGKVAILEPSVKDFTKLKPTILGHFGSDTSVLPNCTCLLTLFFPPVFDAYGLKLCPEQRISLSPVQVHKRMLLFDYRSQLFWNLSSGAAQDEWRSQPVKTTLYLRWQTGEALECYGYISLEAVGRDSGSFQTSLVLVGTEEARHKNKSSENQDPAFKVSRHPKAKPVNVNDSLVSSNRNKMDSKPVAAVDIGLTLVRDSTSPKHVTRFVQTQEEQEPWIYLNLQSLLAFFSKMNGTSTSQSMLLVVKSGSKAIFVSMRLRDGEFMQKFLDAVVQPRPGAECMLFLEVWSSLRAYEGLEQEQGLGGLVGMLKVPYSMESWKERKSKQGSVKLSGSFKVWHPSKMDVTGKVGVVIVLALRHQVVRMQRENHAAAVIQYFYRKSLHRKPPARKLPRLQRSSSRAGKDNSKHVKLSKVSRTLHVFDVNVQRLFGLPCDQHLKRDRVFIKYIFPGEPDPFFTPESDWQQDCVFDACVQHKVSLPGNASVCSYIETIDRKSQGLRFEIWRASKSEEHFGTATLSQESLLDLVSSSRRQSHQTRRLFHLPITVLSRKVEDPKLVVEVAYKHSEYPEDLLKGTIFAECPPGFLEAALDIKILRARGLQDLALGALQGNLNPYVRFSLFPSNRELELLYPPSVTPFKENSVAPYFGWSNTLRVSLTPEVVEELQRSKMSFELWHHSSKARRRSSLSAQSGETDIWLATASAPCSSILTSRKGVTGWLSLASRKKEGTVGKLEVEVSFCISTTNT